MHAPQFMVFAATATGTGVDRAAAQTEARDALEKHFKRHRHRIHRSGSRHSARLKADGEMQQKETEERFAKIHETQRIDPKRAPKTAFKRWQKGGETVASRQDCLHHFAVDVGQSEVSASVLVRQFQVVEPEQVQLQWGATRPDNRWPGRRLR